MASSTNCNSFTPLVSNTNGNNNHNRIPKSVLEVCEGLWSVQGVNEAQSWLQLLYETILSNYSPHLIDPSETFLCLQGAALRFPQSTDIWELALWCAAALSRVCIGPAWRFQRTMMASSGSTDSTSIESTSPKLFSSPRGASIDTTAVNNLSGAPSFPYIPQVLPGAILRFAASSPHTDRRLAEAQRELVLSLVCTSDVNNEQQQQPHTHVEWTIPGVHEAIQSMVLFWIQQTTILAPTRKEEPKQQDGNNNDKAKISPKNDNNSNNNNHTARWLDEMIKENEQPNPSQHGEFLQRLEEHAIFLDWWYTLKVARACSDLLSAGWRPGKVDILSLCLINIAQQGVSLQNISKTAVDRETREERLAAISSAAEAMAGLASLGSKGWLCPSRAIVLRLLELQLATSTTTTTATTLHQYHPDHYQSQDLNNNDVCSLYPLPQEEHAEEIWLQERDEFISQRSSCFADTADLVWVSLAQETNPSSSELVMSTLLERCRASRPLFDEERASVIVRIVSWALWGKPPSMRGIPSLRVYWIEFMEILYEILTTRECCAFVTTLADKKKKTVLDRNGMTLILEIVVALQRLAQTELMQGNGILIREEWVVFQRILSEFIISSLRITTTTDHDQEEMISSSSNSNTFQNFDILHRIQSEAKILLCQLGEYLNRCATHKYHLIVDDERRDAFHFLLLRQAVPLLKQQNGLTQSLLAMSVLNSVAAIGFMSIRRINWLQSAQAIMADAFAVYDDDPSSKSKLPGDDYAGYVHSPLVRLEALRILTIDDSKGGKKKSSSYGGGKSKSSSIRLLSPLSSLTNFPEEYLEMVKTLIVPYLDLIFERLLFADNDDASTAKVFQYSKNYYSTSDDDFKNPELVQVDKELKNKLYTASRKTLLSDKIANELFELRKYAIGLIGILYCNDNIPKNLRSSFLNTLQEIAMGAMESPPPTTATATNTNQSVEKQDGNDAVSTSTIATTSTTVTARAILSLEAVGQLEKCLCAPFFSFPHTHGSIPATILALCSVLDHYALQSSSCDDDKKDRQQQQKEYSRQILLFAALSPLARLRRAQDGDLLLVERERAVLHFPDDGNEALHSNIRPGDAHLDDVGSFIAPFARVDSRSHDTDKVEEEDDNKDITLVSFQPIIESLVKLLSSPNCLISKSASNTTNDTSSANSNSTKERDKNPQKRFRSCCYDAILGYILSGLSFPKVNLVAKLLSFPVSEGAYSGMENFTRIRASIAVFQCSISEKESDTGSGASSSVNMKNIKDIVEQLLPLCGSRIPEEAINGCSLLLGLFPSIRMVFGQNMERLRKLFYFIVLILMSATRDYLRRMPSSGDSVHLKIMRQQLQQPSKLDHGPSILFCLYGSIMYYFDHFSDLSPNDAQSLVRLCYDASANPLLSRLCRTIAVRCAVSVLDRMGDDILDIWPEYSQTVEDDRSLCVSTTSELEIPDSDQIICAMQHKILGLNNNDNGDGSSVHTIIRQAHLAMAEEVENMKAFDHSKDAVAAWLFGDHLLTCKVGGRNSRYCGWVEVAIRGATFRHRQLIRLTQSASVERPELPSPLWNNNIAVSPSSNKKEKNEHRKSSTRIKGDEGIIEEALALLERSEQVLKTCNRPNESSSLDIEFGQRVPSVRRIPSSDDSQASFMTHNNEISDAVLPIQIETTDQSSFKCWLQEVLNNVAEVEDVAKELSDLGFVVDSENNMENDGVLAPKTSITDSIVRLRLDSKVERAINFLDRTVPVNTHKIALLYASPHFAQDKDDETEMDCYLKVQAASPSFFDFTKGLGELVMTKHLKYFSAGLDTSGHDTDGEFALVWIENASCSASTSKCLTIYHAVPFMPQNLNNRKRHVGNDSVHIIFADPASSLHERLWADGPEEEMENCLIGGEFGFVTLFIIPVNDEAYRVKVQLRPGLPESIWLQLQHLPGEHVLPKDEAPEFVRRLANLADIACAAAMHDNFGPPNSWEIRLGQLRSMVRHVM